MNSYSYHYRKMILFIILITFIAAAHMPCHALASETDYTNPYAHPNSEMIDLLSSCDINNSYLPVTIASTESCGDEILGYTCKTIDDTTDYSTEINKLRQGAADDMSFLTALYEYIHDNAAPSSLEDCTIQTAVMLTQAGYINALVKSGGYLNNLVRINGTWYILNAYRNIYPMEAASYSDRAFNYIVFSYDKSMIVIDSSKNIILVGINDTEGLEEYTTPDFVTAIGYRAFNRNKTIRTFTITSNITRIYSYAFSNAQLTNITIEDGNNNLEICSHAFFVTNITKLNLPQRVTVVGESAFFHNTRLKELTIQGSPRIQSSSFGRCSSLERVSIPASLKKIPVNVFTGCNSIFDIYYGGGASDWAAFSSLSDSSGNETLFNSNIHYYDSAESDNHVHTFTKIEGKAATCTSAGKNEAYFCTECAKLFADSDGNIQINESSLVIHPKGHIYGEKWLTDSSMHYAVCSVCDSTENIAGVIHSFVWVTDKDPTASEYGLKHEECTICHYKRKKNTHIEKLHVHSYTHVEAKAATCTYPGNNEYYYCSGCGDYLDENKQKLTDLSTTYIPAYGHDWIPLRYNDTEHYMECDICKKRLYITSHSMEEIIDKKPTVYETGSRHMTCTICGYSNNYETIEKLPELNPEHASHTITHIPATEATCTKTGNIEHYKCTDCDCLFADAGCYVSISNLLITIPVLPHEFNADWEWDISGPNHYQKCINCGLKTHTSMHETTWVIDSEPQIGIPGSRHIECVTCGKREEENTPIPALTTEQTEHKHRIGETIEARKPTCTEYGQSEHYVCTDCGMCYTNAPKKEGTLKDFLIAPLGHSYSEVANENGHILYCFRCDSYYDHETLTPSELQAVTPHTFEWVVDTDPTIEHRGLKHRECTVCGYKTDTDTEIDMIHIYDTSYWCSAHPTGSNDPDYHFHRCIYYYCDKHIDVEPHEFEWVTDKEPTFYEQGGRHVECVQCGYRKPGYSETIPMLVKPDTTDDTEKSNNDKDATQSNNENSNNEQTYERSDSHDTGTQIISTNDQSGNSNPTYIEQSDKPIEDTASDNQGLSSDKLSDSEKSSSDIQPPKPTKIKLKAGKKSFTISWKKISNVKGYEIRYSTKTTMKGAKKKIINSNSKTSVTVKKLKKGRKYYVRLYSFVTDPNGKRIYSKAGSKKNIKVK